MDRYLSKCLIDKREYQLVAVASMLISCKYEEIYFPEIRDFIYITDKSFTKEEIIHMEYKILSSLNFDILTISSFTFLERFSLSIEPNEVCLYLAHYLLELTLVDNRLDYPSSMKALSSLVISRKLLSIFPDYPYHLQKASGYAYEMLRNCIKDFCSIIDCSIKSKLQAVRRKFASEKYKGVSTINLQNYI
jgi:cyclin B